MINPSARINGRLSLPRQKTCTPVPPLFTVTVSSTVGLCERFPDQHTFSMHPIVKTGFEPHSLTSLVKLSTLPTQDLFPTMTRLPIMTRICQIAMKTTRTHQIQMATLTRSRITPICSQMGTLTTFMQMTPFLTILHMSNLPMLSLG